MKRFKIQATFYVQAESADDALAIANDMMIDAVDDQYEHVELVTVVGEVEQDEFHEGQEE